MLDKSTRRLYISAMPSPVSRNEGITIRDWNQVSTELIFLYDSVIEPRHLTLQRYFEDMSAVFIREGEATLQTPQGEVLRAGRGHWVLASQGERSQSFAPGSSVLSIHFLISWPGRLPVYDWEGIAVIPSAAAPGMEEAGERLFNYVSQELKVDGRKIRHTLKPFGDFFGLYGRFLHWMEHFVNALAAQGIHPTRLGCADPRALKAAQLLERRSFREPLAQTDLAAEVNLSVNQLTRIFKTHFRMTPKAFLERRRAREAYLRVQNSNVSFKEIAYDLGFYSPAHFSTWFGQRFSHTPREVREYGHNLFPQQL